MLNQNLVRLVCCIPLTVSVLTLSLPFSTTAAFSQNQHRNRRPMTTSPPRSLSQSQSALPPPVAKKVEHRMELFNDVRIDNYYWLRDDSRSDPDVLSYLSQENAYADSVMSGINNSISLSYPLSLSLLFHLLNTILATCMCGTM